MLERICFNHIHSIQAIAVMNWDTNYEELGKPLMPQDDQPLSGAALVKEVCRRIRVARSYWDAHNNAACRRERDRALQLYNTLTPEQKEQIPQVLRVWLRYRSEKYFGPDRTPPGTQGKKRSRQPRKR